MLLCRYIILTPPPLQDSERLSSSVADDLQVWFSSLAISDVAMTTTTTTPIPSLLVSDHDSQEEKEGTGLTTPIPTETPPPLADGGTVIYQSVEPPLSTIISDSKSGMSPKWTAEDDLICVSEESGVLNNGYYRGRGEGEGERGGGGEGTGNGETGGLNDSASGQPKEKEKDREENQVSKYSSS